MLRTYDATERDGVLPEGDDLELNMTPMIDIVFQLIVFFLLSLKFKTIDQRIEAMLPNVGEADGPPIVDERDKIKLKVFRREIEDAARTYTLVKLDNTDQFRLPAAWKGRARETPERLGLYDRTLTSIRQRIEQRVAIYGGVPARIKAEIVAPPPLGGAVPHGDVVALMDVFIQAGLSDVSFEGAARPLNSRERAARAARR